jgi:hypothetical protein
MPDMDEMDLSETSALVEDLLLVASRALSASLIIASS